MYMSLLENSGKFWKKGIPTSSMQNKCGRRCTQVRPVCEIMHRALAKRQRNYKGLKIPDFCRLRGAISSRAA